MNRAAKTIVELESLAERITSQTYRAVFRYAKDQDIAATQIGSLMRMSRGGKRSIMRIGGDLSMTGPAMSQMIDRFVAQGLVTRKEDPDDRRAKLIDLTPLGAELVAGCKKAQVGWVEAIAARLDEKETEKVIEVSRLLAAKLDEMDAESPYRHGCEKENRE
jgi:DNA-binding MarR family transcriptional regulator